MSNLLHTLKPEKGSRRRKRIVGRGTGSGHGKTATRGMNGQKARAKVHLWFEGGQTPLHRRLPLRNRFRNINHKEYAILNLDDLENLFNDGDEITPEILIEKKIIKKLQDGVKVLGFGNLKKKVKVSAHKFSATAEKAITKAGGEVIKL